MDGLQWALQNTGETLLLVAVNPSAPDTPGAYPCRVIGRFFPPSAESAAPREDAVRVSQLLTDIGVPGNLLGCAYLRTALLLLLREPALGRTISRNLYPRIADQHGTYDLICNLGCRSKIIGIKIRRIDLLFCQSPLKFGAV